LFGTKKPQLSGVGLPERPLCWFWQRQLLGTRSKLYVTSSLSLSTLNGIFGEVTVPLQPFRDELANRRRTTLLLFYLAAVLSVVAVSLAARVVSFHTTLLVMAVVGATVAILFLLRFLRSNHEHEQQINYRALTFAFTGTLVFSASIGFLQSFGFHAVSWLGIPALMITLWSIGLILYSWRYR
jgi:heme/copper-type cytochrome/quinol oxidase subunit 4